MPINKLKLFIFFSIFIGAGLILHFIKNNYNIKGLMQLQNFEIARNNFKIIKIKVIDNINRSFIYSIKQGTKLIELVEFNRTLNQYIDKKKINNNIILEDGEEYYLSIRKLISGETINLNKASLEDLCMLPMINKEIAQSILEYRMENGKFHNEDELRNIKGLNVKRINTIKNYINLGE